MKKIKLINDLGLSSEEIQKLPIRKKSRGIIFLDKNTLVCVEENTKNIDKLLGLPGGALENNENEVETLEREVLEETGYKIKNIIFLGIIEVVRRKYLSTTYCYTAKTNSLKAHISLTPDEVEVETRPLEIDFLKAFTRINQEYNKNPNDNSLRSILMLGELKN